MDPPNKSEDDEIKLYQNVSVIEFFSSDYHVGSASRSNINQQTLRVLNSILDPDKERHGFAPVDNPVIV